MGAKPRKPVKRKSTAPKRPPRRKSGSQKPRRKASPARPRPKRRTTRRTTQRSNWAKIGLTLGILVSLVSIAGIAVSIFWHPPSPITTTPVVKGVIPAPPLVAAIPHKKPQVAKPQPVPQPVPPPTYEVYTPDATAPPESVVKPVIPPAAKGPRVALIIDDMGYDLKQARRLMDLKIPLTLALFPYSPHQKEIARLARARDMELMLHMPMEPKEYPKVKPGPGALLQTMTPDELVTQLIRNLDTLPDAVGINNHMGSLLTAQAERMNQIFIILKKRGLFFVDSRTTTATQAPAAARLLQLPFAQRDVFLDHEPSADFVRGQVRQLIRVARRDGHAIGIGHPYPITHQVLREMLPQLKSQVQIVPASKLVRPIPPA